METRKNPVAKVLDMSFLDILLRPDDLVSRLNSPVYVNGRRIESDIEELKKAVATQVALARRQENWAWIREAAQEVHDGICDDASWLKQHFTTPRESRDLPTDLPSCNRARRDIPTNLPPYKKASQDVPLPTDPPPCKKARREREATRNENDDLALPRRSLRDRQENRCEDLARSRRSLRDREEIRQENLARSRRSRSSGSSSNNDRESPYNARKNSDEPSSRKTSYSAVRSSNQPGTRNTSYIADQRGTRQYSAGRSSDEPGTSNSLYSEDLQGTRQYSADRSLDQRGIRNASHSAGMSSNQLGTQLSADQPNLRITISNRHHLHADSSNRSQLQGITSNRSQLQGSTSNMPHLQGSTSNRPHLQGDTSNKPHLQGDTSNRPHLQGSTSNKPHLQGDTSNRPHLQGNTSNRPHLQGNTSNRPPLQGDTTNNPLTSTRPQLKDETLKKPHDQENTHVQTNSPSSPQGQSQAERKKLCRLNPKRRYRRKRRLIVGERNPVEQMPKTKVAGSVPNVKIPICKQAGDDLTAMGWFGPLVENKNVKLLRERICHIDGCKTPTSFMSGHLLREHMSTIFDERYQTTTEVSRQRYACLKLIARKLFGQSGELRDIVDYINGYELIRKEFSWMVSPQLVMAMVSMCRLRGWRRPETFMLRPINSPACLLHWRCLLVIANHLKADFMVFLRNVFDKEPGKESAGTQGSGGQSKYEAAKQDSSTQEKVNQETSRQHGSTQTKVNQETSRQHGSTQAKVNHETSRQHGSSQAKDNQTSFSKVSDKTASQSLHCSSQTSDNVEAVKQDCFIEVKVKMEPTEQDFCDQVKNKTASTLGDSSSQGKDKTESEIQDNFIQVNDKHGTTNQDSCDQVKNKNVATQQVNFKQAKETNEPSKQDSCTQGKGKRETEKQDNSFHVKVNMETEKQSNFTQTNDIAETTQLDSSQQGKDNTETDKHDSCTQVKNKSETVQPDSSSEVENILEAVDQDSCDQVKDRPEPEQEDSFTQVKVESETNDMDCSAQGQCHFEGDTEKNTPRQTNVSNIHGNDSLEISRHAQDNMDTDKEKEELVKCIGHHGDDLQDDLDNGLDNSQGHYQGHLEGYHGGHPDDSHNESDIDLQGDPECDLEHDLQSWKPLVYAFDSYFQLQDLSQALQLGVVSVQDALEKLPMSEHDDYVLEVSSGIAAFCDPAAYPELEVIDRLVFGGYNAIVGVAPGLNISGTGIEQLQGLLDQPGVVGLGEVGLDHSVLPTHLWYEQEWLLKNLVSLLKPEHVLVLRIRGPTEDQTGTYAYLRCLDILQDCVLDRDQHIQIHCFTGNEDIVVKWLQVFPLTFFSFCGAVEDFSNEQREGLKSVPGERLLLESNAPFFPVTEEYPVSAPHMLDRVAKLVADIRQDSSLEELLELTESNARLFLETSC